MISANGLTFEYPTGEDRALDDVSFSVDAGEVLGVVGPIEAGKTTLSLAISGFVPQLTGGELEGDITVAGVDPREDEENRVAMVFEDYNAQLTQVRVIDEVVAPLTNRGMDRSEATERARELLDRVRMEGTEEKYTWELSGGQQQRLAIAAVLAIDPEVLVFDTAVDMLDPEGREDVTDLMATLAGEKTLVVTDNDPDALVGLADKLLALDGGRPVAFGEADELLRDTDLFDELAVDPPVCLEAAGRLGLDGTPIDLEEFQEVYTRRVGEKPSVAEVPAGDGGTTSLPDLEDSTAGLGGPVIEATDVTYEYPDGTVAIADLDLTVHEGEVHAVIGGNGAGKSTLSKLLVGLMNPTTGTITVSGTDTSEITAQWLGETIGIALQNPDEQISRRTVDGELRYPLEQRRHRQTGPFGLFGKTERYDEAYMDNRVAAVRDLVNIPEAIREKDPAFLPRGQRRLVTIASALAPDPDAIVLDEPTAGVDSGGADTVAAAIENLWAKDKAVVLIEHDMEFVCEMADRVTVLEDGEVAMQGTVPEVFARDNREWLSERHMRPPRIARLASRVGVDALTMEQFVERAAARVEAGR